MNQDHTFLQRGLRYHHHSMVRHCFLHRLVQGVLLEVEHMALYDNNLLSFFSQFRANHQAEYYLYNADNLFFYDYQKFPEYQFHMNKGLSMFLLQLHHLHTLLQYMYQDFLLHHYPEFSLRLGRYFSDLSDKTAHPLLAYDYHRNKSLVFHLDYEPSHHYE